MVLFHIFYYYSGKENCLLYQGFCYIEVCYTEVLTLHCTSKHTLPTEVILEEVIIVIKVTVLNKQIPQCHMCLLSDLFAQMMPKCGKNNY